MIEFHENITVTRQAEVLEREGKTELPKFNFIGYASNASPVGHFELIFHKLNVVMSMLVGGGGGG